MSPAVANLLLAQQQQQQVHNRAHVAAPHTLASLGLNSPASMASSLPHSESPQTSVLLSALLRQQEREEQKKAALLHQLNSALVQPPAPSASDKLAMLLQQKHLSAGPGNSMNSLSLVGSSVPVLSQQSPDPFCGLRQGNQQHLDSIAIAKLLQSQQQQGSVPGPPQVAPQAPTSSGDVAAAAVLAAQLGGDSAAAVALLDNAAISSLPAERRRKGRTGTFPQKLHQMLSDLEREEGGIEIASFLPHGRAFAIHKPRDFVKHVMPKYFRMSRFSSFQRQLNLYDFQRITEGPDKGSYYHELFVQGRPILSTMMKRNKIKGVKNMKPANDGENHDAAEEDEDMNHPTETDNKEHEEEEEVQGKADELDAE